MDDRWALHAMAAAADISPEEVVASTTEAERAHVRTWTDDEWLLIMNTLAPDSDVSAAIALVEAHRETQAS